VREIAALTGAKPRPGADRRITGIAALDRVGSAIATMKLRLG